MTMAQTRPSVHTEARLDERLASALEERASQRSTTPVSLAATALAVVLSRHLHEREIVLLMAEDEMSSSAVTVDVDPRRGVGSLNFRTSESRSAFVRRPLAAVRLCQSATTLTTHPPEDVPVTIRLTRDSGLQIDAQADPESFDDTWLSLLVADFERCLRRLLDNPRLTPAQACPLEGDQRSKVLVEWNRTRSGSNRTATIVELFAEQVRLGPDRPAVKQGQKVMTYHDLDTAANRLAHQLIEMGVQFDAPVAVCLDRSLAMIVALVGILKAGAGYLPLDPRDPRERLGFILEDSRASVLITEERWRDTVPEAMRGRLLMDSHADLIAARPESSPDVRIGSHHLAYVQYRSGSSGEPNGVEIPHLAVCRLVRDVEYVTLAENASLLQSSPLSLNASTFEIWGALLNGGCCVLHDELVPTASGLRRAVQDVGVTTLWLTASVFNAVVDDDPAQLDGVRNVLIGDEQPSPDHIRRAQAALPNTAFVNTYGVTETTLACCYRIPAPLPDESHRIPIGRPLPDTEAYVLDEELDPVPEGGIGELFIGGDRLARGYLNRPQLNAERFIVNPFLAEGQAIPDPAPILYRTGDLVRWTGEGTLIFHGRTDNQVKVGGYRIEPGEIEAVLAQHGWVECCAVIPLKGTEGRLRLVAYVVAAEDGRAGAQDPSALRDFLLPHLPEHMVPATFVWLDQLPMTSEGKLDRAALSHTEQPTDERLKHPSEEHPDLATADIVPSSQLEEQLCAIWSEATGVDRVGVTESLLEVGGDSIKALRVATLIQQRLGIEVAVTELMEQITVRQLAAHIDGSRGANAAISSEAPDRDRPEPVEPATAPTPSPETRVLGQAIAIVGMAGRFPGAADIDQLWSNLLGGVDSTTFFDYAALDPMVPASLRDDPAYVRARGVLDNADLFDTSFFGFSAKEAAIMDPQQRIILEIVWEALEAAGHPPDNFSGQIGVFAGKSKDSYYLSNLARRPDVLAEMDEFETFAATERDYLAPMIAQTLGLNGPAISIHTEGSTSLVAICEATASLRAGECDLALAGGVSITVPVNSGHLYRDGGRGSADGRTRPFDADASGTTFGDGAAVVVLRRLEDAVKDGDQIFAIIRGVAVNDDRERRAGFTTPSVTEQAAVVTRALADAGVGADTISYIEAHGAATPAADAIEVEALTRAFPDSAGKTSSCSIGSVKSNLGNLTSAAGVTGVIKTALALHHQVIPASINFQNPNPSIDFASTPFSVAAERTPWLHGRSVRRAGVSAFGVDGSCAHIVLEEAPRRPRRRPEAPEVQVYVLSARTPSALRGAEAQLAAFLTGRAERDLADIAHTLQSGRKRFVERAMTVALSHTEAAGALAGGSAERHTLTVPGSPVAFMFPGQGAQHAGMGKRLYGGQPWFREEVDRCAEILLPIMGRDLREILFADGADSGKALRRPDLSQPALFTIEYALAVLWRRWGVEPQAMVGHDVGEFVAAVLAEVMTLEDALRLVAARGRLLQDLPAGSMMAVSMPLVDLEDRLASHPALAVSAENANDSCVVSGPTPEIERLFQELKRDQIGCRTLLASHAFHSAMVDPALEPLAEIVGQIELRPPRIPIVSTATGIWLTDEQATDPGYWTGHMRTPIRFGAAIGTLVAGGPHLCLEVGPRATLTAFANRQLAGSDRSSVIASLSDRTKDENRDLLTAAGRLWLHGIELDWESLRHHAPVRRRRLPTYPFERERHWIEPAPSAQDPTAEGPQGPFESPISEDQPAPIVSSEQSQSQAEQGLVLLEKSLLRASSTATVGTGERRRETPTATDLLAGNPLPGMAGINLPTVEMSDKQRARLEAFTRRYGSRTAGSRDLTQANRPHLAHPYAVGGFDPVLKELAYPIVIGRSLGSRVWDVDGNEYIDVVNGFGSCFLGWQSPPVVKAVQRQIKEGFEVATIHPLAGEVARLLCDVTGFDRAGFCNTGSEAVLDAIRLARAVTGRSLIAIFAGSDHGIFDAFVAAGSNVGEPVPAAGENVIVLEYGTPEAIAIIKEHASELAAVLVEPIQKHRPEFRPQEFLHELRELTEQAGIAYIIDEVVTGIRMAPGGAQAILGFKGDIAIYGGPVGGGFPIGIIAGRKAWMDGVDGGDWKYGDDSMPTIANSYLSATAVGQPLALAAAKAVLEHLIDSGSEIQDGVNRLTCDFATRLNAHFGKVEAPLEIQHFGSLWKPAITGDHPYGKLLFPMLRDRGVHILESAPCFFTTAHTEDDVIEVDRAFRDALVEIREAEFLPSAPKRAPQIQASEVDAALSV